MIPTTTNVLPTPSESASISSPTYLPWHFSPFFWTQYNNVFWEYILYWGSNLWRYFRFTNCTFQNSGVTYSFSSTRPCAYGCEHKNSLLVRNNTGVLSTDRRSIYGERENSSLCGNQKGTPSSTDAITITEKLWRDCVFKNRTRVLKNERISHSVTERQHDLSWNTDTPSLWSSRRMGTKCKESRMKDSLYPPHSASSSCKTDGVQLYNQAVFYCSLT